MTAEAQDSLQVDGAAVIDRLSRKLAQAELDKIVLELNIETLRSENKGLQEAILRDDT
jgi:hypothetical protein